MKLHILLFLCLFYLLPLAVRGQQSGEAMFNSFCSACHTISKGKLIGPDLADVHLRRTDAWLYEFIAGSQAMVKKGDETAVALFAEYNQVAMPDAPFSAAEIKTLVSYIKSKSPGFVAEVGGAITVQGTEPEEPVRSVTEATQEEIRIGQLLFTGQMRLNGRGPACISCHHVKNDQLIGGGLLAKELTDAYSRLNETGIKAILTTPPFPAMREAYLSEGITEEEAFQLTAFLKYADEDQYGQHPRDYQQYFLIAGGSGFFLLLLIFSLIWANRKKSAVNQKIFNRQVYS